MSPIVVHSFQVVGNLRFFVKGSLIDHPLNPDAEMVESEHPYMGVDAFGFWSVLHAYREINVTIIVEFPVD
jgi:hypothetical protein